MTHVITRMGWAAAVAAIMMLSGCPKAPELVISPAAVTFGSDASEKFVTIQNLESHDVTWQVREVARADEDSPWVAADVSWLLADPYVKTQEPGLARLALYADRSGLRAGAYGNVGVEVSSGLFSQVIPVSIVVNSTLEVSPSRISLRPGANSTSFFVKNTGVGSLSWNVYYLPSGSTTAEPLPSDFIVQPNPGSTLGGAQTQVSVNWTEDRGDFSLVVDSIGGYGVVNVVFGAALPGLTVAPETLYLYYTADDSGSDEGESSIVQPSSTLTITNVDSNSHDWTIEIVDVADTTASVAISATPNQGATGAGEETEIAVRVTNASSIRSGSDNYELIVRSGTDGYMVIPLVLETITLPTIEVSDPPQTDTSRPEPTSLRALDFGRETIEAEMWVVNIGTIGSKLYFKVVQDEDNEENQDADPEHPLITSITPLQGNTNLGEQDFYIPNTNHMVDGTPISVVVDRTAMTKDVEYRNLRIEAWNEDYTQRIDAVDPVEIEVRVERPPLTFEGSLNRSRPPFLVRFVFLLRDTLGKAIPTMTSEDLARLNFTVAEDEEQLDLNETNQFLDGAENIKTNLILMLDYTGSMYNAGVSDTEDPAAPGEILGQVNEAAMRFLDDLPEGYRISLMYYYDRQQTNRVLYPFTTDREALKSAIKNFSMPVSMHGVSEVWEAVQEAVDRLVAEDPEGTLPFDEADFRGVVFITDGKDNSSSTDAETVASDAFKRQVRLYPLSYAPNSSVNSADLIKAASESRGHLYSAGNARKLVSLLGNQKSLVLSPEDNPSSNQIVFDVVAGGSGTLSWNITRDGSLPWITNISPSAGVTLAGDKTQVVVSVDPTLAGTLPLKVTNGTLTIDSSDGVGEVMVRMQTNDAGTAVEALSATLKDEPGLVWSELQNQLIFTYVSPQQKDFTYTLTVDYLQADDTTISGAWEEDSILYGGDVRAGQLSLSSAGMVEDPKATSLADAVRADAYLRADYVPRNVSQFRVRFFNRFSDKIPAEAIAAFTADVKMAVEIAEDGLLTSDDEYASSWRIINEGDGIYSLLTDEDSVLKYGSSGNLLRLRFTGLKGFADACKAVGVTPAFLVDMRADNQIYLSQGTSTHPSETVYFLYPSGPTCIDRPLLVSDEIDIAGAARTVAELIVPGINPEAYNVWDKDEDGLVDFQDTYPDNDTQPSLLTLPTLINLSSANVIVVIRNNRLDTFTWSVTTTATQTPSGGLSGRILVDTSASKFTLAPGESTTLTMSANRSGLLSGTYEGNLVLKTDAFGEERTPITVTVN